MFKHILVTTDGTKLSAKAVKIAVGVAAGLGAKVTGLHVLPATTYDFVGDIVTTRLLTAAEARERESKASATVFKDLEKLAVGAGVSFDGKCTTSDDVYGSIIATAKKNRCDCIVMASHGRRGLAGLIIGSETHKVLTHSSIPVLVCR
jgi:nucleotide-binding universal stress UspA family protein